MPKDKQEEFDAYAARRNEGSPFRHALRATGITDDKDAKKEDEELELRLLLDETCVEINAALAGNDNATAIAPLLDTETLLKSKIGHLLKRGLEKDRPKGTMSMLDVVTLGLTDESDIKGFLKRHGVDLTDDRDLMYVHRVLEEAIGFYEAELAQKGSKKKETINKTLRETGTASGICKIFQTAAGKHQRQLVPQACGLLRIALAIDTLNRDPLLAAIPEAQEGLQRIENTHFPKRGGKCEFRTRKPGDVPMELVDCEIRTKTRPSMIAKLLHKPQNKAKEVVDHIGMRITTKSPFDALKFLYSVFFKPETAIFPGMNIDIGETRQLLLSEKRLMEILQNPHKIRKAKALVDELSVFTIDHSDLVTIGDEEGDRNPFSSKQYRAIQITFNIPITTKDGRRLHFPLEIQIVDQASKVRNEAEAPHADYVRRKTNAIGLRVTKNNLLTEFEKARRAGTLDDVEDEES